MVSLDGAAHTRACGARVQREAGHRMIPAIEETTARLLDAVAGLPEFDLVASLAFPLPANIVFSLVGVPEQDYPQLKQWCGYRAALSWGRPAAMDQVDIAASIAAYRRYLRELVDAKVRACYSQLTGRLLLVDLD